MYFQKNEENESAINSLVEFITSPIGNTLFNKILQILDESLPDVEEINLLANTLTYVVKTDFLNLFYKHKYALSEMARITPQALIILSDYRSCPDFYVLDPIFNDLRVVQSDWLDDFTNAYCKCKGIDNAPIVARIKHSINQLIFNRHIECITVSEPIEFRQFENSLLAKCQSTTLGLEMLEYITPEN